MSGFFYTYYFSPRAAHTGQLDERIALDDRGRLFRYTEIQPGNFLFDGQTPGEPRFKSFGDSPFTDSAVMGQYGFEAQPVILREADGNLTHAGEEFQTLALMPVPKLYKQIPFPPGDAPQPLPLSNEVRQGLPPSFRQNMAPPPARLDEALNWPLSPQPPASPPAAKARWRGFFR